ncbi:MAG: hypothetical protein PHG08_01025 [Bacilli bacterium]|nr:hypothetical protein [Bacilli bacterium]
MKKTAEKHGYEFYTDIIEGAKVYNIVKSGSPAPKSGYYEPEYILHIKGFTPKDVIYFEQNELIDDEFQPFNDNSYPYHF